MKILLVGHSVEDYIHYPTKTLHQPGGVFYSVVGLSSIKDEDDEIHLCSSINKNNYNLYSEYYDKVDRTNLLLKESAPVIHLYIHEGKERDEIYENITSELPVDKINPEDYYGILINMITGFDISISNAELLRNKFDGLIFLDVHSLSRVLDENSKMIFRKIPDTERWLNVADIVQANTNELLTLTDYDNEKEIAEYVLNHRAKILIITKEDKGAIVYYKDKSGDVSAIHKPALDVPCNNKVGCGDVFGAVFFYTYLKHKDVDKALKAAIEASGLMVSYNNMEDFKKLRNDLFSRHN
ncbi:MAG TPA: carbohydrate kinase family protein [Ignavibacteriaceae bacterium]|nr:carbohydrate kinase family protein [Ignavibacteriaceae bacterium]